MPTNVKSILLTLSILLLASPDRLAADAEGPGSVDFVRDVRPIFERHCVHCHQGDRPPGGLALTTAKSALAGYSRCRRGRKSN